MRLHRSIAPLFLCFSFSLGLVLGCQPKRSGFQGDQKAKDGDSTRPTEDGEGFEGYIADPDLVRVEQEKDGNRSRVSGDRGAVASENGSPEQVTVGVWDVDDGAVDGARASGRGSVAATSLKCLQANRDGSFRVVLKRGPRGALLVTGGRPCPGSEVGIISQGRLHTVSENVGRGTFRPVDGPLPKTDESACECPTGQSYHPGSNSCEDQSNGNNCMNSQICGCDGRTYSSTCEMHAAGVKRGVSTGPC